MARAALLGGLVALASWLVHADYQFGAGEWERIGTCDNRYTGPKRSLFDYPTSTIQTMAQSATRVKICTNGSTTDCVTSIVNSFPIKNLQSGLMLVSHNGTNPQPRGCPRACVEATWEGPATRISTNMVTRCGFTAGAASNFRTFYWACGNPDGIHISVDFGTGKLSAGQCEWDHGIDGRMDIFIDSGTPAPTTTPTPAPTEWFESYDALAAPNLTQLEDRITFVEAHLSTTTSTQIAALDQKITDMNAVISGVITDLSDLIQTVNRTDSDLQTQLASLITTLTDALDDAGGSGSSECDSGCLAQVRANDDGSMDFISPGALRMQTEQCNGQDLCDVAKFSDRLKNALNALKQP